MFYALILIRIIIVSYSTFFGSEVYHCDDIPSNENVRGEYWHNVNNQESSWYNNYQSRNQYTQYPTTHSDGTPRYEPYNEGLQSTSNGHRYELPNNETGGWIEEPTRNLDQFTAELDGVPIYARYHYTDMQGKDYYSYSYDGSTQIGIIEPTRSEVIGNGYYQGTGWTIVDTSPSSTRRRVFNNVKNSVKNHIAKSSDEAIRQRNMETKKYCEDIARAKSVIRARKAQRINDMLNNRPDNSIFSKGVSIGSKAKKVRRFD